ncbi:MAG: hypothetical protein FWC73_10525 [Defluviitaleaceae bacterium]|nr:hypothetical protein [Defluviitaleaceae bacterium]
MRIKFVATCLTVQQRQACKSLGIEITQNYATSYGEITPGCVTDFSVHCFNSATLQVLMGLGVKRASLHPELNLPQMRDIKKCIDTEAIIYGKLPLMKLGNPVNGSITDRTGAVFFIHGDNLYNSVPIFMADRLDAIEKAGITYGRFIFTTEDARQVTEIINAYFRREKLDIKFTRGKF